MHAAKTPQCQRAERASTRIHKVESGIGGEESFSAPGKFCRYMDGFPDARIGSAAAEISGHRVIYIRV
jgi:hypothetical protein